MMVVVVCVGSGFRHVGAVLQRFFVAVYTALLRVSNKLLTTKAMMFVWVTDLTFGRPDSKNQRVKDQPAPDPVTTLEKYYMLINNCFAI